MFHKYRCLPSATRITLKFKQAQPETRSKTQNYTDSVSQTTTKTLTPEHTLMTKRPVQSKDALKPTFAFLGRLGPSSLSSVVGDEEEDDADDDLVVVFVDVAVLLMCVSM